jgi:hypothetical protein
METRNQTQWHPVHSCNDGVFNSISGKQIDLIEPTPEMICINDIAHALSMICRFGGHSKYFYPVAVHSVLVCALAPDELKREALLHDATEAYVGDVIKPLKVVLGQTYENIEHDFMISAIAPKFNLDHRKLLEVKKYDKEAIEIEHEYLQKGNFDAMADKLIKLGRHSLLGIRNPNEAKHVFYKEYARHFDMYLTEISW